MIEISNVSVHGFKDAIRGMRNPMNSWDMSDSCVFQDPDRKLFKIGINDITLMRKLSKGGPTHGKFKRMITIYMDILAPLYWWKEFDTYKVGTVANSCSTMHKIHAKEFEVSDFSTDKLFPDSYKVLGETINALNEYRDLYLKTKGKKYWYQLIQLLPSSYNQKRTVMLNYEVATHIYNDRKDHKLEEWHTLCEFFEQWLPLHDLITGETVTEMVAMPNPNGELELAFYVPVMA